MAHDVEHNRYHQAFEDFLHAEAERAIAEATRHTADGKRLWVLLYEDGRYAIEHTTETGTPALTEPPDGGGEPVTFPVTPLVGAEYDPVALENSDFAPALDRMWAAFREAHSRGTH